MTRAELIPFLPLRAFQRCHNGFETIISAIAACMHRGGANCYPFHLVSPDSSIHIIPGKTSPFTTLHACAHSAH